MEVVIGRYFFFYYFLKYIIKIYKYFLNKLLVIFFFKFKDYLKIIGYVCTRYPTIRTSVYVKNFSKI